MKQGSYAVGILLAMCVTVVTLSSIYVLDVTQQVFITRFGKIVGKPITEPGLKFKVPIVDKVNRFDKRYLEWDGHRNQVTTGDQRFIEIDTYARWRILDARTFFEKVKDESGSRTRLDDILDGADVVQLLRIILPKLFALRIELRMSRFLNLMLT